MVETPNPVPIDMDASYIEALCRAEANQIQGFQAIGAFVFEFSQLDFTIRAFLAGLLKLPDAQFDIVTGPYDFAMLCRVSREIAIQRFPKQKAAIEDVFNRCLKLNDDRVKVAHGMWSDTTDGRLAARHVGRNSLKAKFYFGDPKELPGLRETAQKLMKEVLFVVSDQKDAEPG
jgi:hypothetical protein